MHVKKLLQKKWYYHWVEIQIQKQAEETYETATIASTCDIMLSHDFTTRKGVSYQQGSLYIIQLSPRLTVETNGWSSLCVIHTCLVQSGMFLYWWSFLDQWEEYVVQQTCYILLQDLGCHDMQVCWVDEIQHQNNLLPYWWYYICCLTLWRMLRKNHQELYSDSEKEKNVCIMCAIYILGHC